MFKRNNGILVTLLRDPSMIYKGEENVDFLGWKVFISDYFSIVSAVRNAQVTSAEKPQMKFNRLINNKVDK